MVDYDEIGGGYARVRQPDPRIAERLRHALGDASTVVNVGAGAGSYEPTDVEVTAVEPSATMIAQRSPNSAPAVKGRAEALPFADVDFDAALAILTLHHWDDWRAGLAEMRRVASRRVVVLTWDPAAAADFWLHAYLPEMAEADADRFPAFDDLREQLMPCTVESLPIPHDCTDGFLAAYWRRPHAYLDPQVRAGISSFSLGIDVGQGLARLARDLDSGAWASMWGHLSRLESLDVGYRILVCTLGRGEGHAGS